MTLVFFYKWPTLKFLNAWAMTLYELCCHGFYMKYIVSHKFCFLLLNYIWICDRGTEYNGKIGSSYNLLHSNGHDDVTMAVIAVLVFNNGNMTSMRVTAVAIFNNGQHDVNVCYCSGHFQ